MVPGKCHHTKIRQRHKTDNQQEEKPEPEKEEYLLDDDVCRQQTEMGSEICIRSYDEDNYY